MSDHTQKLHPLSTLNNMYAAPHADPLTYRVCYYYSLREGPLTLYMVKFYEFPEPYRPPTHSPGESVSVGRRGEDLDHNAPTPVLTWFQLHLHLLALGVVLRLWLLLLEMRGQETRCRALQHQSFLYLGNKSEFEVTSKILSCLPLVRQPGILLDLRVVDLLSALSRTYL